MSALNAPPLATPIVSGDNVTLVWHRFFLDVKDAINDNMAVSLCASDPGSSGLGVSTKKEQFTLMGIMGTL